jgi:hypothetical protein
VLVAASDGRARTDPTVDWISVRMRSNVETVETIGDDSEALPEHNTFTRIATPPSGIGVIAVRTSSIRLGESPRLAGENAEHIKLLAATEDVPPILVHRRTMRVIDGAHRLQAARLRGDETIAVRFFDGDDSEAYLLAVDANIKHGLPLSQADREAAAVRILALYPLWSDRAVAAAAGLSATTVGMIRRRQLRPADSDNRVGRDGKTRPVDGAAGRLRASAVISRRPDAPLRAIAAEAGVSVGTARDVRARLAAGLEPVLPAQRTPIEDRNPCRYAAPEPQRRRRGTGYSAIDWRSLRGNLARDPAVRYAESGRAFVRWVDDHVVEPGERGDLVDAVPAHWRESVAELARSCANAWLALAQALEDQP